jgi:hypothetical protein
VLSTVTVGGGTTTVTGTLKATPNSQYRIEYFASHTDPLGQPAEGQEFLGSIDVMTDASGTASVDTILAVAVANGYRDGDGDRCYRQYLGVLGRSKCSHDVARSDRHQPH